LFIVKQEQLTIIEYWICYYYTIINNISSSASHKKDLNLNFILNLILTKLCMNANIMHKTHLYVMERLQAFKK
jgi:hypothetical protein